MLDIKCKMWNVNDRLSKFWPALSIIGVCLKYRCSVSMIISCHPSPFLRVEYEYKFTWLDKYKYKYRSSSAINIRTHTPSFVRSRPMLNFTSPRVSMFWLICIHWLMAKVHQLLAHMHKTRPSKNHQAKSS